MEVGGCHAAVRRERLESVRQSQAAPRDSKVEGRKSQPHRETQDRLKLSPQPKVSWLAAE